jgi:hypothetical protein
MQQSEEFKKIIDGFEAMLKTAEAIADRSNCHYDTYERLKQMRGVLEWTFTQGAPFKVGDRAVLRSPPEINKKDSWGWMHAKHFLVAGAVGSVADVKFYNGVWCVGFCPDEQTFKSSVTGKYEPADKGIYNMGAHRLEKVAP